MSYCYYVKHKPTGLKYYGYCSKSPKLFWKTYFTSSEWICYFINRDGIESFDVKITRIFSDPVAAQLHESRMFKRAKLNTHPMYLNCKGNPNKFGRRNKNLYTLQY